MSYEKVKCITRKPKEGKYLLQVLVIMLDH